VGVWCLRSTWKGLLYASCGQSWRQPKCLTAGWTNIEHVRIWQFAYLLLKNGKCISWLNCDVLAAHSSDDMTHRVSMVLKVFPDITKLFLTTCHDGASNCMKTSRLLKSQNVHASDSASSRRHCALYKLNLLTYLLTYSMCNIAFHMFCISCSRLISQWVSSFLTAHQHIKSHSEP